MRETRLAGSDGHRAVATAMCLASTHSKPERVMGLPQALRNSSGAGAAPRTASQARIVSPTDFQSVRARSRRPLPRTRTST